MSADFTHPEAFKAVKTVKRVDGLGEPSRRAFQSPKKSLDALDAEEAGGLIEAASDLALVLDRKGVIQDLAVGSDDMPLAGASDWIGRPWVDIVAVDSRPKVESLLNDTAAKAADARRWRHINHPMLGGADLPILCSAVTVGPRGRVVVIGRDLRALAAVQQRLVDAQHALERDYWRLRHLETRYRLLFDISPEAILIVDVLSGKVMEANPAALELLGMAQRRIVGQAFPVGLDDKGGRAVAAMLARVRSSGRSDEVKVRHPKGLGDITLHAAIFKQEDAQHFLVRLVSVQPQTVTARAGQQAFMQVIENAPDGFVVTDPEGRVLQANAAFVELTQLTSDNQLRGQSLDRWLARPGVDLNVMLATLRQQGSVRLFNTSMRGEHGAVAEVEISGVSVLEGETPCLGFTVRHIGRRLTTDSQAAKSAPRSVEQLAQLVGRMPLKDLVRESTDLIEQLCIEAALELTQDNRASAAEMLGLSRQSLYVKLRRYGLGDLNSGDGATNR